MVILTPPIKPGSQLFRQATCVFLHVVLSKLQLHTSREVYSIPATPKGSDSLAYVAPD